MSEHGTTGYRKGCRCCICRVAKKKAAYKYWSGDMKGFGDKCLTPKCGNQEAPGLKRGLCVKCHSKAKAMVGSGRTTWEQLEAMGLAKPQNDDPFIEAFNEKSNQ